MIVTTGVPTACAGGGHIVLPITRAGNTRQFKFQRSEIAQVLNDTDIDGDTQELRSRLIQRLAALIEESGATTNAEVRAAISNKTIAI